MMSQLVSIIIPVFNREDIVKKTLNSVLTQTYKNWECIIVDDGSTDNTINTLNKFESEDKRYKVFSRPHSLRKGANSCRNYGFTKSKGVYVNWFDSDDIMSPNFIQEKIDCTKPKIDGVLHKNEYANYELTRFRESKFNYSTPENLFYHYAIEDIELQTSCFMWRRDYLSKKELFDVTIDRYQDNDFHIRMLALKPALIILDKCLATIRGGDGDSSQISSKKRLTKKKIVDRFNYLIKVLVLNNKLNKAQHKIIQNKVSKKALWCFYEVLKFEKKFFKRIQDLMRNYSKLVYIYKTDDFSTRRVIKSQLYIYYILILGNFYLINKNKKHISN